MSGPFGFLGQVGPERVLELLGVFLLWFPFVARRASFDPDALQPRIVAALDALQCMVRTRCGPGRVHIETLVDQHALGRANQHVGRIGQVETDFARRMIGRETFGHVALDRVATALHRHERQQTVAAVDAHALGDGPQVVGGIKVSAVVASHLAAPSQFSSAIECQASTIVHVSALGVSDVAEQALFSHLADHQHMGPVATVFRHHVDPPGFLLGADQPPAFVQRHGGGHFAQRVFARPHRGDAYLGVYLHARAADDRIQVVPFEHPQVISRAFRVSFGLAPTHLFHDTACAIQIGLLDITQCRHFHTRIQRESQQVCTPAPNTDDREPDRFWRRLRDHGRSHADRQSGCSPNTQDVTAMDLCVHVGLRFL